MYNVGVITISDKGAKGLRVDTSGKNLAEIMKNNGYNVTHYKIIPDDIAIISQTLIEFADDHKLHLILTTGGTGLSPKDMTPEATLEIADKIVPGISEAMRAQTYTITPKAVLSRGVAVIRGRTLIINLPGSEKASQENLEVVLPALKHGIDTINQNSNDCQR